MKIVIKNLTFEAILGILESERVSPQKIEINLEIDYIYSKDDFMDYSIIADMIEKTIKEKKFLLIEEAISEIVKLLKDSYTQIQKIDIEIFKPDILKNAKVGIRYKEDLNFCKES